MHFAVQLLGDMSFKEKLEFLWRCPDPLTDLARWACLGEWRQFAVFAEGSTSAYWKHLEPSQVLAVWRTLTKHGVEVHRVW